MHLILAQKGQINEGNEAVDLGQSPGDILVLSAADTEIASLCQRLSRTGWRWSKRVRLANLMQLAHPMSVDTYAERTAIHARLIVVRVLVVPDTGPGGLKTVHAGGRDDIAIAVLPGDDKADPALQQYCICGPKSLRCAASISDPGRTAEFRQFPSLLPLADGCRSR
ncbi:MAG: hypothetical protein R3D29_16655 [Nitratireductor sp.]